MEKKRKNIILCSIALLLVAGVAFLLGTFELNEGGGRSASHKTGRSLLVQKGAKRSAVKSERSSSQKMRRKPSTLGKQGVAGRLGRDPDAKFRDADGNAYPESDQKLMRSAQEVIEKDDLAGARELAAAALTSSNTELRDMVVDALGWFGQDTLAELLPFMSDKDEDVAENAKSQWMSGLQEIESDGEKAGVIELALGGISDKDMLEDIANELVGIDELAAIQVLANVILDDKNSTLSEIAKETYNTITSEDWTDIDAAEAWLQKNYEADDD